MKEYVESENKENEFLGGKEECAEIQGIVKTSIVTIVMTNRYLWGSVIVRCEKLLSMDNGHGCSEPILYLYGLLVW